MSCDCSSLLAFSTSMTLIHMEEGNVKLGKESFSARGRDRVQCELILEWKRQIDKDSKISNSTRAVPTRNCMITVKKGTIATWTVVEKKW